MHLYHTTLYFAAAGGNSFIPILFFSYYSQIKLSCSITDRQVTLRSLTAFFLNRFAIGERWGISSPKPLAWGPVPRPLLRFALKARFYLRRASQQHIPLPQVLCCGKSHAAIAAAAVWRRFFISSRTPRWPPRPFCPCHTSSAASLCPWSAWTGRESRYQSRPVPEDLYAGRTSHRTHGRQAPN